MKEKILDNKKNGMVMLLLLIAGLIGTWMLIGVYLLTSALKKKK